MNIVYIFIIYLEESLYIYSLKNEGKRNLFSQT